MRFLTLLLLLAFLLVGCVKDEPERVVPPRPAGEVASMEEEADRQRALNTALDTLEALVVTLEHIQDPISAWNRAADAARLLAELERTRPAYAFDGNEHEAARRYPGAVDRLKRLEARRDVEMNRIMEDRVIAQVLAEEMVEAERAAARADTTADTTRAPN